MADPDFNWAKKGDRAFKPSVSAPDQMRLEAFAMPTYGTHVIGFKRAADIIVDAARSDDLNPDILFFPVAYLYRHHLELMLKELVRLDVRAASLEGGEDILGQHNLHKLWKHVKHLINEVWPDSAGDDLKAVEQVILEFHKLDPTGQAFRYARDKSGKPHLRDSPDRVDLGGLRFVVDGVSNFLDAAYAGIEHCDPGPP